MIRKVEFPSEGATVRGLLFLPETQSKQPPVIIMAHGTSATVSMVADKYAEAFCRAGTGWINRVPRVIPATPAPYHPALCAPFVKAPTLLMVAPEDEMVHANYSVARRAYELIPGPKQWHDIAGEHFGLLYYPGELFDEASHVQTEFFKTWLSVA